MDIKPGGTAGVTITLVPARMIVWDKGIFLSQSVKTLTSIGDE